MNSQSKPISIKYTDFKISQCNMDDYDDNNSDKSDKNFQDFHQIHKL